MAHHPQCASAPAATVLQNGAVLQKQRFKKQGSDHQMASKIQLWPYLITEFAGLSCTPMGLREPGIAFSDNPQTNVRATNACKNDVNSFSYSCLAIAALLPCFWMKVALIRASPLLNNHIVELLRSRFTRTLLQIIWASPLLRPISSIPAPHATICTTFRAPGTLLPGSSKTSMPWAQVQAH